MSALIFVRVELVPATSSPLPIVAIDSYIPFLDFLHGQWRKSSRAWVARIRFRFKNKLDFLFQRPNSKSKIGTYFTCVFGSRKENFHFSNGGNSISMHSPSYEPPCSRSLCSLTIQTTRRYNLLASYRFVVGLDHHPTW